MLYKLELNFHFINDPSWTTHELPFRGAAYGEHHSKGNPFV